MPVTHTLSQRIHAWLRYRRALMRLEAVDDRLLEDMGIERHALRRRLKNGFED
mgnify:CR=1 FL=1